MRTRSFEYTFNSRDWRAPTLRRTTGRGLFSSTSISISNYPGINDDAETIAALERKERDRHDTARKRRAYEGASVVEFVGRLLQELVYLTFTAYHTAQRLGGGKIAISLLTSIPFFQFLLSRLHGRHWRCSITNIAFFYFVSSHTITISIELPCPRDTPHYEIHSLTYSLLSHRCVARFQALQLTHPDRFGGPHKVDKFPVSARKGTRSLRINRYFQQGRSASCVPRSSCAGRLGYDCAVQGFGCVLCPSGEGPAVKGGRGGGYAGNNAGCCGGYFLFLGILMEPWE